MNFEHPTFQGVNAMVIRNPGCFPGLCAFGVHYRAQVKSETWIRSDSSFFRLENGSKKRVVFLRNDIGMISEFLSAKMERVLASLRVQSYNTKKRIPNFLQFCGVLKC